MLLESTLAYLHLIAIFSLIVFQTSQAALLRPEWFNAAVLTRLKRVNLIANAALAFLLATGLARLFFGIKSWQSYLQNPLMHIKLTLLVVMIALAIPAGRAYARWVAEHARTGALPAAGEIQKARKWVMASSHVMLLIPIFAVLMARGFGWR